MKNQCYFKESNETFCLCNGEEDKCNFSEYGKSFCRFYIDQYCFSIWAARDKERIISNKHLKCPFCKTKLKDGEHKNYETLEEHIFNPNNTKVILRITYICDCNIAEGVFWDPDGYIYLNRDLSSGHSILLYKIKHTNAINSLAEEIEIEMDLSQDQILQYENYLGEKI